LFLNHNVAWSGGTFFRAFPIGRALAASGHDVTLLAISPTRRLRVDEQRRDGVRVLETPDLFWGRGRSGWDPWDVVRRIISLHGNREWDVVHSWDCRPVAILPALWARSRAAPHGARLVTDWADWWGRGGTQGERDRGFARVAWPVETFFEEHFRRSADATTAISSALRDRVVRLGVPKNRVRLLPQGCDPPVTIDRGAARARLGMNVRDRFVLYVGRLNQKDATLLFELARRLLAAHRDARFVLVGRHGQVLPGDLVGHARFSAVGVVSEAILEDYLGACDVSVVPLADTLASRARWPSKVNRLLSAGRAVVITRVGDLADRLERQRAAMVTAPSVDDLFDGVSRVFDDERLRANIEDAARHLAAGELAWPRIVGELEAWYKSLRDLDILDSSA